MRAHLYIRSRTSKRGYSRCAIVRRIAATLASVLPLLLLAGCWDRIEVNDLAIVTAAAIDASDDGLIKLSTQIFVPGGGGSAELGSGPEQGGAKPNLIMSAVGLDLDDAASKLQELLSRRLFWGQADVFVFGEAMAKRGLKDSIDFLTRHPQPRERGNIFVAAGEAQQLISWKPIAERNVAELLREMSNMKTGLNTTLLDLYIQLAETAHTGLIPYIELLPTADHESPHIIGAASINRLKMNGSFDISSTRGLMWLRHSIRTATLTTKGPKDKGLLSMTVIKADSKMKPEIRDGRWKMILSVKGSGNLEENGANVDMTKPDSIKRVEKLLSDILCDGIKLAVSRAQNLNTDVLGFSDEFRRHYPKQWKKEKDNWGERFPQVEVEVIAEVEILKIGLTGRNKVLEDAES